MRERGLVSGLVAWPVDGSLPIPSLSELRSEIERLDRILVRLVALRLSLARHAIERRRGRGEGPTDLVQERRVVSRARRWAIESDVSPELVEGLLRSLIEAGKSSSGLSPRARLSRDPMQERFAAADEPPAGLLPGPVPGGLEAIVRSVERHKLASHEIGDRAP